MRVSYLVTPETISKFKEPFGRLIEGSFSETKNLIKTIIDRENPPKIISVGDTVTRNLHKSNIIPQLSITDNKSMRRRLKPRTYPDKNLILIQNPQGEITQEAIDKIQQAIQTKERTHILVQGEEDLLTLIAVMYAPKNSLVIYGQPKRGVVIVKVTPKKRGTAQEILTSMKKVKFERRRVRSRR